MNIIELKVDELIPYENNPRKNDEAVDKVALSISAFGFKVPIVIDANKVIVTGHTRLKAAKKLGFKTVPCIVADDLTDEQIKGFRLADNKVTELSTWDFEKLEQELNQLDSMELDFEMSDFGFDDILEDEEPTTILEDEPPEPPTEPKAKLGDLWQLGSHRLICGNSTDPTVIDRLMDGVTANTYIFDPPYEKEELYDLIPQNGGGRLFVFSDHKHFAKAVTEAINKKWQGRFEFIWDCCQSWYTPNRPLARHKTCYVFGDCEKWEFDKAIIHDGKNRDEKVVRNTRGNCHYVPLNGAVHMRTVESFPNTALNDENGYGKPVKWIAALLQGYGGENVMDLFGGSGTTLIACEQLNRKCYMAELDPKYVSVILQRYINFKGSDADVFLLKDGKKIPYSEVDTE